MDPRSCSLESALFQPLFDLDEVTLAARDMRRMRVDPPIGSPCRVSLEDAPVGEEILLLPFAHQDRRSPYRVSGPILVCRDLREARHIVGELPPYLTRWRLSLRAHDAADEIAEAAVIDGAAAEPLIEGYLARADVSYLHVHFARRSCYACRVDRG